MIWVPEKTGKGFSSPKARDMQAARGFPARNGANHAVALDIVGGKGQSTRVGYRFRATVR